MAGMFYKLKEAAEKLGVSEKEVKELVKGGKLREFRDGAELLYKVEEVESLKDQQGGEEQGPGESVIELAPSETGEVELKPDDMQEAEQQAEPAQAKEQKPPEAEKPKAEKPKAEKPKAEKPKAEKPEDEDLQLSETGASETGGGSESINVLSESDSEYQLTDDTKAETKQAGTADDELGKIEEDVNLDSFGSGSGLLDLSLQADDTSLGADILDDIYPGGEGQAEGGGGDISEAAAEADQMVPESTAATGAEPELEADLPPEEPAAAPARAMYATAAEEGGNAVGYALLIPLVALVYTAVITVAGLRGVTPSALTAVTGVPNLIWYIAGGAAVAAVAMIAAATMLSQKRTKGK